jgi:hypothetical protein
MPIIGATLLIHFLSQRWQFIYRNCKFATLCTNKRRRVPIRVKSSVVKKDSEESNFKSANNEGTLSGFDFAADELSQFEAGEPDENLWAVHLIKARGDIDVAKWAYLEERCNTAVSRRQAAIKADREKAIALREEQEEKLYREELRRRQQQKEEREEERKVHHKLATVDPISEIQHNSSGKPIFNAPIYDFPNNSSINSSSNFKSIIFSLRTLRISLVSCPNFVFAAIQRRFPFAVVKPVLYPP